MTPRMTGPSATSQASQETDLANPPTFAPITEPPDLSGKVRLLNNRPIIVGNYSELYIGVHGRRKVAYTNYLCQ